MLSITSALSSSPAQQAPTSSRSLRSKTSFEIYRLLRLYCIYSIGFKAPFMSFKFCFSVKKMKLGDMSHAKRHNKRIDIPSSQIPDKSLWFSSVGHHSFVPWNDVRASKARSLMERKDAVVGLEFVIQIGNQDHYRERDKTPNKSLHIPELKASSKAIHEWATKQFGSKNIVSLDLHTDESTPHFHLVVAAIDDTPAPKPKPNARPKKYADDPERLNVKRWISGKESIINLRKSCHSHVNGVFPCEYSSEIPDGGKPHDPSKSVASNAALRALEAENERLQKELDAANQTIVDLESKLQARALENFISAKFGGRK
jgi:hypothetical protein